MTHPTAPLTRSEDGNACHNEWVHWKRQWNANFCDGHRSLFEVRLPNGRTFSFSFGQLILFGLLVWWLPFNWLVLGVVLFVAYQISQSNPAADTPEKPKRKNDESRSDDDDDDIVEF